MDVFLIVMAFICLLLGIIGSVVPGLPGPPISWVGLLLAGFTPWVETTPLLPIVSGVIAVVITLFDYIVPSLTTRHMGGGKYGVWGCNIGLIISIFGLPFGPTGLLGVILWPFIGALVGEYVHQQDLQSSVKAAFGAFLGFITGTLLKLAYCIIILAIVVTELF